MNEGLWFHSVYSYLKRANCPLKIVLGCRRSDVPRVRFCSSQLGLAGFLLLGNLRLWMFSAKGRAWEMRYHELSVDKLTCPHYLAQAVDLQGTVNWEGGHRKKLGGISLSQNGPLETVCKLPLSVCLWYQSQDPIHWAPVAFFVGNTDNSSCAAWVTSPENILWFHPPKGDSSSFWPEMRLLPCWEVLCTHIAMPPCSQESPTHRNSDVSLWMLSGGYVRTDMCVHTLSWTYVSWLWLLKYTCL
jgi:hypothetical protein